MILILIALLIGLVAGIALLVYAKREDEMMLAVSGVIFLLFIGIAAIVYAAAAFNYIGASYKAEIINREFKTQYTQAEVFWADDVIDAVRELDRQRIELNGNLIAGKGK